jgi:Short C-terminal domain
MAKITFTRQGGWPMMVPLGAKEAELLQRNVTPGEVVLGQVIGQYGQTVVATNTKVIVIKTGLMAGQSFGGKSTTFDYHNIAGVEVRTGFAQGELAIINPSMPSSQGNRNRDKVNVAKSPNGVVFVKGNATLFQEFATKVREMAGNSHTQGTAQAAGSESIPDQIRQLGELRAAGVITDDEFSAKKTELLGRM